MSEPGRASCSGEYMSAFPPIAVFQAPVIELLLPEMPARRLLVHQRAHTRWRDQGHSLWKERAAEKNHVSFFVKLLSYFRRLSVFQVANPASFGL